MCKYNTIWIVETSQHDFQSFIGLVFTLSLLDYTSNILDQILSQITDHPLLYAEFNYFY